MPAYNYGGGRDFTERCVEAARNVDSRILVSGKRRQLTPREIQRRTAFLESAMVQLTEAWRHELRVDIPRLQCFALQAIERPQERFPSEKSIARTVLNVDIPEREKRAAAALLLLESAPYKDRALYILGDYAKRERMTATVIANGGLFDEYGKWAAL